MLGFITSKISLIYRLKHKSVLKNLASLGLIHGTNVLLPLLTFPYLVRILGVEKFGLVALVQTVMGYFVILTDYGFNLAATKDVSIHRNNLNKISRVFTEVMGTKIVLLFISLMLVCIAFLLVPEYQAQGVLIYGSFFIVLGQVLQPVWLFQGLEQMRFLTYLNLLAKGVYTLLIFSFISEEADYIYVNFINGISMTLAGLVSLLIVFSRFGLRVKKVSFSAVKKQLKKGGSIFVSSVSITISNNTNLVILSLFADAVTVGYYSIAEKVFMFTRTFAGVLYQAVYPNVCMLAQESFAKLAVFLKQVLVVVLVSFLPLCALVFIFSGTVVSLIAGEFIPEATTMLRILSFGALFAALNIPASQTLLAYHLDKDYALISSGGAALNVLLNVSLAYLFGGEGTATAAIITESGVTLMLYLTLNRYYPQYSLLKQFAIWK